MDNQETPEESQISKKISWSKVLLTQGRMEQIIIMGRLLIYLENKNTINKEDRDNEETGKLI